MPVSIAKTGLQRARAFARRWHAPITVLGVLVVVGALALALAGDGARFEAALTDAPIWILSIAALLQIVWLLARSEAWNVCVSAAGGTVGRTRLYRASSLGYLGGMFNGQFGLAVRIAALRRSAPQDSPRAPVLVAAEFPIIVIEGALAALMSFTLVVPLKLPWWVPLLSLAFAVAVVTGLTMVARNRQSGFWKGLAVLRGLKGRTRIVALVIFAVSAQVARNWLLLQASGVNASVLDSVAVLIAIAGIGLLPLGPSVSAAAAVAILGSHGVAATAAAGVLLTVTGAVGAILFAGWALVDRLWIAERSRRGSGFPLGRRSQPAALDA
jgi:hypothetical protein